MYDRKKYGDRIRQLRIQNEYTQEELAEKLGIDTSLLDDLEAGKKECPVELVVQFSNIFGVTIDMLDVVQKKLTPSSHIKGVE